MTRAFNGQAKLKRRAVCADPERVAEGVWLVRGGFPVKSMNVYLIEDEGGGVTMFEAGIKAMVDRTVRGRVLARRPQPDRARPRPRRSPRRRAGPGRADLLPSRPTGSTPRATAACTTSTSRPSRRPPMDDPAAAAGVGRRPGGDRRHGRRGRRRLGLPRRPHPRPLARPDRAVARVRPRGADRGLLLHARPRHRPPRAAAHAALRLQPRHRAGARLDPQDRRARAVGRLARPRRPGHGRRPRASSSRRPSET